MYGEYIKQKQKYKDEQKDANRKHDYTNVLNLFAARHILAVMYYEFDYEFPIENELNEIGEKLVEFFELEFNTEHTIEDDGFAPINVKTRWSLMAFLFNSDPYIVNAEISRKAQEASAKAMVKALESDDEYEEYTSGNMVTPNQAFESVQFLNSIKEFVLLREDDVEIGGRMFAKNPGINKHEEDIIKNYLHIYISSKWQATLKANAERYAYMSLLKDNIKNDILSGSEADLEQIAKDVAEYKTNPVKQLTDVLKKSGLADADTLQAVTIEKENELLAVIRDKSEELATNMVNNMLSEGFDSQQLLANFREQQQIGWGQINAAGTFGIAKQFAFAGVDAVTFIAVSNELELSKLYFKRRQYKTLGDRELFGDVENPPDFPTEPSDLNVSLEEHDLDTNKRELEWYSKVEFVDNYYGKCYQLIKLSYGLLRPFLLFMNVFYPGGFPSGYAGYGFQLLQAIVYIGWFIGVAKTLNMEMPEFKDIPDVESQSGYMDYFSNLVKGLVVGLFTKIVMFITWMSQFLLTGDEGRYLIMAISIISILTRFYNIATDYSGGREGKSGFKSAISKANLGLKTDMKTYTFDLAPIDREIEASFEGGGGNMKELARRITAHSDTVDALMKVKDEQRSKVSDASVIANIATQARIADAHEESVKINKGMMSIAGNKLNSMKKSVFGGRNTKQKKNVYDNKNNPLYIPDVETDLLDREFKQNELIKRLQILKDITDLDHSNVDTELTELILRTEQPLLA
jgi:hypothetical protein